MMSEDLVIYEVGVRYGDNHYAAFLESPNKDAVLEHARLVRDTVDDEHTVVFMEKTYRLISTIPHIFKNWGDDEDA
jgi:hypothetical protein